MNLILKALAAFIIALSGLIMCRGWISVFSQNPSFINSLMSLFQQNLDIVSLIVLILSFLCTIFLLIAFSWAIGKTGQLEKPFNRQAINTAPARFIGKTKQEVLEIIFKESPRLNDGSLNIMTVTSQRKYNNYYYKTMDDAIKDEKLMATEIWQVDFRKEFAISIFHHETAIELYFENGKVVKYKISNWSKT